MKTKGNTLIEIRNPLLQIAASSDEFDGDNILFTNTTVNQCMTTKHAWQIDSYDDGHARFNNHLDFKLRTK